jgi:hypothetical protein
LPVNKCRGLLLYIFIVLLGSRLNSSAVDPSPENLLPAYVEYTLIQRVASQAMVLCESAVPEDQSQVQAVTKGWSRFHFKAMRGKLQEAYSLDAPKYFEAFVNEYLAAESSQDADFLAEMNAVMGWGDNPAKDYTSLQRRLVAESMKSLMSEASTFLTEVETWVSLRADGRMEADFDAWLQRQQADEAPVEVDPLEAAEIKLDLKKIQAATVSSPLDSFINDRKALRQRKLLEAEQGIALVNAERTAAEQQAAAELQAKAKAEAAAIQHHAAELAKAEENAMIQRERSWANRLKKLAGAAVGTVGGAILGASSAHVADQAVSAIFD